MDERTTSELIETLGDDIDRCHCELIEAFDAGTTLPDGQVRADYEYHARQLIRAIFAFIEAVTFSAKIKAIEHCEARGIEVSPSERYLAGEIEHSITNNGEISERSAHIRLTDNIRFAFRLLVKSIENAQPFDASVEWWSCLKTSIKVRDRIMHPKMPEDIDLSGDEIVTALKAYEGFKKQLMIYADMRDG